MLVLTRKASQVIKLGDNITITVMRTANGSVRLGIDAPPEIRVLRGELAETQPPEFVDQQQREPQAA